MNHTLPNEMVQTPTPVGSPKGSPRRPWLKIVGIFVISFLALAVFIPLIFEKQIGEKLISALNEQLSTEMTVENFELSLFTGFPKVAASLEGVVFKDTKERELLKAEAVSFHLGLFSLLSSEAKVQTVYIEGGQLLLEVDKEGKGNYSIIKPRESAGTSDFSLAIEEAIVKDIKVAYYDLRGPHKIDIHVDEAQVKGKFSSTEFDLEINGEAISQAIDLDGHKYLVDKSIGIAGIVNINLAERKYTFEETTLDVEKNPLRLGGSIQTKNEQTIFDLQFLTKDGNLKTLIGFLPDQYTSHLTDLESDGSFNMVARIKGPLATNLNPAIDIRFGLGDGKIKSEKYRQSIRNVSFKGSFSNGKENNNETSKLEIQKFKGSFHGQQVDMGFVLKNIERPKITLTLDGKMPMEDLEGLINLPNVAEGKGFLALKDIRIHGKLQDLINPRLADRVDMSGRLTFQDLSFNINDQPVKFDDGRLLVDGNKISLNQLKFNGANSELLLSGRCYNLLPMIFADAERRKTIKVRFNVKLNSPNMDLDALAQLFSNPETTTNDDPDDNGSNHQFLTSILEGTFKATVDKFHYNKITGQNFHGFFEIDNNELALDGEARGMEGRWILDGTVFLDKRPHADARLSCRGISLPTFFEQANNFGQSVLRHEHLEGKLLANLKIDAFWNEQGEFLMDDLLVLGDVAVTNGELKNFEMLYDFSNYIKMKDLRHVRFTTMRNWLRVKDRKIHIPRLFVRSNALNLELCGIHTFENKIDYNLRVNAGQVIFNKFKKYNPQMLPVKAQKEGILNLNYRIYGSVNKYKIKTDAKHVKRRLANSAIKKKNIKNKLSIAFGELDIPEENWVNLQYEEPLVQSPKVERPVVEADKAEETDIMASTDKLPIRPDDLGPSADSKKEDEGFRLIDIIDKEKPKRPTWDAPAGDDEDEFMDFEIEGKTKPPKKGGGNN